MHQASQRLEFAPAVLPGQVRAFALALAVHGLLVAALAWGVQWKRESQQMAVDAELWASVPQPAAPKTIESEPVQPTPPPIAQRVPVPPTPAPKPVPQAVAPAPKPAIAQKAEKPRVPPSAPTLTKEQQRLSMTQREDQRIAAQREENLKHLARLARLPDSSASDRPPATASVAQGPNADYAGRIRARVKPNIVFTETVVSNPSAEVEVRTAPDGTIIGIKLVKPSGLSSWDAAVVRALERTATFPRNTDGTVPRVVTLEFRPRD